MTSSIDDAVVVWVAKHRFAPANDFFIGLGTVDKLGAIWIACADALPHIRASVAAGAEFAGRVRSCC